MNPEDNPLFKAITRLLETSESITKDMVSNDAEKRIDGVVKATSRSLEVAIERVITPEEKEKLTALCMGHDSTISAFHAINTMMVVIGPERTRKHVLDLLDTAEALDKLENGEAPNKAVH